MLSQEEVFAKLMTRHADCDNVYTCTPMQPSSVESVYTDTLLIYKQTSCTHVQLSLRWQSVSASCEFMIVWKFAASLCVHSYEHVYLLSLQSKCARTSDYGRSLIAEQRCHCMSCDVVDHFDTTCSDTPRVHKRFQVVTAISEGSGPLRVSNSKQQVRKRRHWLDDLFMPHWLVYAVLN